jgi:hypothetical protein
MNGSWPAIYVQKATALGIFEDVVNGGATGADRGDVAIMLFNALDLPEVYADGDGATQYKNGSTSFTANNQSFYGTSMLATLNKSGTSEYGILGATDADDAVIDVRSYVGAVGKIYKDKDGDVISIGDLKTEFLTGTVNGDGDEFTSNGTKYTINDDAFSVVNSVDGTLSKNQTSVPKFVNGKQSGTYGKGTNGALDEVKVNQSITIAAKVSGKTITNILTVSEWSKTENNSPVSYADQRLFEESDANTISNKQTLAGYDFKTNDNGDIDYTTFILTGVDSLDDIEEDNVVYTYADSNKVIRKVEVGTEIVEGTLKSFTVGTKATDDNVGTQAKFDIDGTTYQGTNATASADVVLDADHILNWTLGDSDPVEVSDDVKAYLDATGKIFQIEQLEAGASSYALVLDYDIQWENGSEGTEVRDSTALNGNDSLVKVLTASGDVVTLTLNSSAKNAATVAADENAIDYNGNKVTFSGTTFSVGDIITYTLNSSNKVKKITVKADATLDTDEDPVVLKSNSDKITAKGYYSGKAINDSAVIFTAGTLSDRTDSYDDNVSVPRYYLDEDDADVTKLASLLDKDDVPAYAKIIKNGKYTALVLSKTAVSNDVSYGLITSVTNINDDSITADYKVTMLVNGESKEYYVDDDANYKDSDVDKPIKNVFYGFKTNVKGYISGLDDDTDDTDGIYSSDGKTYIGVTVAGSNGISVKSNVVTDGGYTIDSNAIYYKYNATSETFEVGDKSDMTGASAGKVAIFLDTDEKDDKDKVADVVIIAPATVAQNVVASVATEDSVDSVIKTAAAEKAVADAITAINSLSKAEGTFVADATDDDKVNAAKEAAITAAENAVTSELVSIDSNATAYAVSGSENTYDVELTINSTATDLDDEPLATDTATVRVTLKAAENK